MLPIDAVELFGIDTSVSEFLITDLELQYFM